MEAIYEIAEQIKQDLRSKLELAGIFCNLTTSVTDFGISIYFYVNDKKYRVSDHSVENTSRLFNEVHFSNNDEAVLKAEKVLFTERFEKVVLGFQNGREIFKLIRK